MSTQYSGQIATSPSSRGPAVGPSASIGNESTSVGASLPRWSRFSSRIRAASTISTARWPSSTPTAAGAAATGPRRSVGTSTRSTGTVAIVGGDDPLDEFVADHVLAAELDEGDVFDFVEDVADDHQAGALVARQVDLGDVAGHHHPRAEAEPGEEHLHLLGRRVLRLVEDHEGVVEGAAAHEGKWRDLDHVALEEPVDAVGVEHVVERVEERAQVGVDLGLDVTWQEAEPLARLDRGPGEDDPLHFAFGQRGGRHRDREEGLAGTGGADAKGDRGAADGVDVAFLVQRFRREPGVAGAADHGVEGRPR